MTGEDGRLIRDYAPVECSLLSDVEIWAIYLTVTSRCNRVNCERLRKFLYGTFEVRQFKIYFAIDLR